MPEAIPKMGLFVALAICVLICEGLGQGGIWLGPPGNFAEYYLFDGRMDADLKTHNESQNHCKKIGGELAFISSKAEQDFVENMTSTMDNNFLYKDLLFEEYWVRNKPFHYDSGLCLAMNNETGTIAWTIADCESIKGFVCQRNKRQRSMWFTMNSAEFYVSPENMSATYTEAKRQCKSLGGDLATTSRDELKNFASLMGLNRTGKPTVFFIDVAEDVFSRVDGRNSTSGNISREYTAISASQNDIKVNCSERMGFICQKIRPDGIFNPPTKTEIPSFSLHLPSFLIGICIPVPFVVGLIICVLCRHRKPEKRKVKFNEPNPQDDEYEEVYQAGRPEFEGVRHGGRRANQGYILSPQMGERGRGYTGYEQPMNSTSSSREEADTAYEAVEFQ